MLYFFLLLAAPSMPACILMLDHAPIPNDYLPPVCPIHAMPSWDWYELHLMGEDGQVLCVWQAAISLSQPPCQPFPARNYHIEVWLNKPVATGCNLWQEFASYTPEDIARQCPTWLDAYNTGDLLVVGPFKLDPPAQPETACTLPQVDNSHSIYTTVDYKFLQGRLDWWGLKISNWDWQNQFDEAIRGAADAAGVPAALLKAMIAQESQFWPLWTGSAAEVGWMQVTWQGAETALRHDPELLQKYCRLALWVADCSSYDLLTPAQRSAVLSELVKDLAVSGTPQDAADQAESDLWTYAHILRAYACQAAELYPDRDVWQSAAVLYNAGTACIQGAEICEQGEKYLSEVLR